MQHLRLLPTDVAVAGILLIAACSPISQSPLTPSALRTNDSALPTVESRYGFRAFTLPANVRPACALRSDPTIVRCGVLIRMDARHERSLRPAGYGPSDLQNAYNLPSATQGKGQTIAVIEAGDDPNAGSDLAVYRETFILPACTMDNRCFSKLNQRGKPGPYPSPNSGWAVEESLDVDMVSAICPKCNIVVVEADRQSLADLGKSVDTAVRLGANAISNSYGLRRAAKSDGQHFNHPGTIITASAGDGGYGIQVPALYPTVVSVGGTSLTKGGSGRGWSETVWPGTGSGCAKNFAKPPWQTDSGCKGRTMNDVAAIADPNTGVAMYDTYGYAGWLVAGGTSVASPIVASIYGLAGNSSTLNAAESLYQNATDLYDVTHGRNGTCKPPYLCNGEVGYDGPTGNGTPDGVNAF
jgi:subtilase family serine protease